MRIQIRDYEISDQEKSKVRGEEWNNLQLLNVLPRMDFRKGYQKDTKNIFWNICKSQKNISIFA